VTPNYNYIQQSKDNMIWLKSVGVSSTLKNELSEPLDKYPLMMAN